MNSYAYPVMLENDVEEKTSLIKVDGNHKEFTPVNVLPDVDKSWREILLDPELEVNDRLKCIYQKAYENNLNPLPFPKDIFSVFSMPLEDVKVVFVAQDPYPGWDSDRKAPVANGRCFSTYSKKNTASLSKVFETINNVLGKITISDAEHPFSLKGWIKQGVLLLNNTPVVNVSKYQEGNKSKHLESMIAYPKSCWKGITLSICEFIKRKKPNVKFVLIGAEAHYLAQFIAGCIKVNHPSPMSKLEFDGEFFLELSQIKWNYV